MTAPQAASGVVLLVEDEALVRMFIADALRDVGGFEVLEAANADEALTILQACGVGALVTDVEMPGSINGFTLARRVAETWPRTGIIVVTGRALPGDGDLPAGARFVAKPYAVDTLVGAIRDALARVQAIAEVEDAARLPGDVRSG